MGGSRRSSSQAAPWQDGGERLPVPPMQRLAHDIAGSALGETLPLSVDEEALARATRAVKAGRMGRLSNRAIVLAVLDALAAGSSPRTNVTNSNEEIR